MIDNINNKLGDDLKQNITPGCRLKIASYCFSIYAYEALKKELEKIESLEFIFTKPAFVTENISDKLRKESREFFIPKAELERSLYGSEFEIQLKNQLTQRSIARECASWIRRKATFKSNTNKATIQDYAIVQNSDSESVYFPFSGFTAVNFGYQPSDACSNFIHRIEDSTFTSSYLTIFNQIWNDHAKLEDVTEAICEHIESAYKENSPERIYFLMLYNIFYEFLKEVTDDVMPNDLTGYQDSLIWKKLFNFQRDAAVGIINKLETYNGCILADSVGLGKTFTALAVIKYYELRNRSVLVLCPKKLSDNWRNYNANLVTNIFTADRFNYDVLCHTDLSRSSGESNGIPLDRVNWGNYDLVVIDESHNFRNNEYVKDRQTRYHKLMNDVIKAGVKTKVLMLSATPVNNRFSDLRNQLALAYEGDSSQLVKKLQTSSSVEEIFRRAQQEFNKWSKLPPEERTAKAILDALDFDFFELLDNVTIARSRKHIQTFYDTSDIGNFPKRLKPLSYRCPLSNSIDVPDFNAIYKKLSDLELAVFAPIKYIFPSRVEKYQQLYAELNPNAFRDLKALAINFQALMTTSLLKRLESSVQAFRLTLENLRTKHQVMLGKISGYSDAVDKADIDSGEYQDNIVDDEQDFSAGDEEQIGGKVKISLDDIDVESWRNDLSNDLLIINDLLDSMHKISVDHDAKLLHLEKLVLDKIQNPINGQNKKILVFTAFADTANYIYDYLSNVLLQHGLHTARVTGKSAPASTLKKSYDFQSILTLFSPVSKEKQLVLPKEPEEITLLVGTDCISEGQNLQDCDYLINYDIHWNPVRIIQRFGRIDRIGSTNGQIQLVNYWPDISLDEYINLKERVENRMIIADVTATGDDNVLSAQANDVSYRKEQLRKLQDEVIEIEDLKTGVSITDLGLNDFRMDLINYVKQHGEIEHLPLGLHAVIPAQPEIGLLPGVIFTLRNINDSINVNQHNRLHPYYLIYIGNDGEIIAQHTDVKKLLDLVRAGCKGQSNPISRVCQLFNKQSNEGRNMSTYSALLGQAINGMINRKQQSDLASLFSSPATSVLVNDFSGLDDFELVAFLVIQDESTCDNA